MKVYRGIRQNDGLTVLVNDQALDPRLDLRNHSPTGFECGYGGSGPAQLALAILADHLQDDREALSLYQSFKWKVVSCLFPKGWELTSDQIDEALEFIRLETVR